MSSPSLILYPFSDPSVLDDRTIARLVFHLLENGIHTVAVGLATPRLDEADYASRVELFLEMASEHGISVRGVVLQERTGDLYNYMRDSAFTHDPASASWKSWLQAHLALKQTANLTTLAGPDGLDGLLINNEALSAYRAYINGASLPPATKSLALANSVAIYRDYIEGVSASLQATLPQAAVAAINPQYLDDKAGNVGAADHWPAGASQGFLVAADGLVVDLRINTLAQWDYRTDDLDKLAGAILDRVLWYGSKSGIENNYGALLDSYFSGLHKPVTVEISSRIYDPIQTGFSGLTADQLRQLEGLVEQGIVDRIRALEQTVPGFDSGTIDEVFVRDHIFAGLAMVVPGANGLTSLERFFELFPADNDAPVAVDDRVTALAGFAIPIDVLANDRDSDGFALRLESVGDGELGTTWIGEGSGRVMYRANRGSTGVDTFTYRVSDGLEASYGEVRVNVVAPEVIFSLRSASGAAVLAGKRLTLAANTTDIDIGAFAMSAAGGTLRAVIGEGFGIAGPGDSPSLARKIDGDEALLLRIDPDYAAMGLAISANILLRGLERGDLASITGYRDANGDGVLAGDEAVGQMLYVASSDRTAIDTGRSTVGISFLGEDALLPFDGLRIEALGPNSAFSVFGADFYALPQPAVDTEPAARTTKTAIAVSASNSALVVDGARFFVPLGTTEVATPRLEVSATGGWLRTGAEIGVLSSPFGADRWAGDASVYSRQVNGDEVLRFTLAEPQAYSIVQAKVTFGWIGVGDVILARGYDEIGGALVLVGEMRIDAELDPFITRQDVRIGFADSANKPVAFDSLELSAVGFSSAFTVYDAIFYLS